MTIESLERLQLDVILCPKPPAGAFCGKTGLVWTGRDSSWAPGSGRVGVPQPVNYRKIPAVVMERRADEPGMAESLQFTKLW